VLLFIPHEILPSNTGRHFAKVQRSLVTAEFPAAVNRALIRTSLSPAKKDTPLRMREAGHLAGQTCV